MLNLLPLGNLFSPATQQAYASQMPGLAGMPQSAGTPIGPGTQGPPINPAMLQQLLAARMQMMGGGGGAPPIPAGAGAPPAAAPQAGMMPGQTVPNINPQQLQQMQQLLALFHANPMAAQAAAPPGGFPGQ